MKKYLLLICVLQILINSVSAQYSNLNASLDKTQFCDQSSSIRVSGTVQARSNVSSGYHFTGLIFHFYYFNGSSQALIGNYTVNKVGSSTQTSFSNINSVYFDGSQIGGATITTDTYNPGSPLNGGFFSAFINVPWSTFPTSTGIQFYAAVEAIDNSGSTTVVSSHVAFSNPILNPNPTLTKPAISATNLTLCGSDISTISTNPDLTVTFTYNWYKDGAWLSSESGASINTSSPGTYFAYIYDACQNVTTDNIVITTGAAPSAPTIASSNGTLLCNGALTTLSTSPSGGGTIHWSTGETGNSISVSVPGNYYAYEVNDCGTSGNSNTISISVGSTPPAPNVSSSNGTLLCNGASTTLSAFPSAGGSISWSTGQTGNAISVSSAGNYYAVETNSCGVSANSNIVSISVGSTPGAPTISSTAGANLCNGASTTLTTSPSAAGTVHWNTGATGNSISVSTAGSYYAYEINSCGTSPNSNTINITVGGTPPAPTIASSNGTLLCNGASTSLSTSPSSGGIIHWNTGETGNSITASGAGNYYAYEVNSCGSSSNSNTMTIAVSNTPPAPTVSPSSNQLLCNGASVTLSSTGGNVTWSNGTTGNTLVTTTAGNYYAIDHNSCGNSAASNTVVVTTGSCPPPSPGSSFFVCPGTLKQLDAGAGYDTYQWSDGETTQKINVGPGTYSVTVTRQGCSATSSAVTVNYYSVTVPTISASGPTTICASSSVTLSASGGNAYLWSNGATGQNITVNTSGGYYVTVTDANGCNANSAAINVTVNPLPNASISGNATVCKNSSSPSIIFTGSGGTAPYTFTYKINGGANQTITTTSGNSVSVAVATGSAGTFTYSLVSVQESSSTACSNSASGSAMVTVNDLPTATISGSTSVCQNSSSPSIVFTGNGGSAPYTFVYKINGGSNQIVNTTSGNSVSVAVPTNTPGTFTYTLVSVQESSSTSCGNTVSGTATIVINPLPTAAISGNTTVCLNSASPSITFSGSGGTAPYTFSYKINGGSVQTVSTISGNSVTVSVPTNVAGTFTYSLVSVQDASSTACVNAASGNAVITVNGLPTATISGTTTVCQNSVAPAITFTGSGGSAPFTFTYKINGGSVQAVSTTSGNSVTVSVPTNAAGTFSYSLVSVQESSSTACNNTASGTATVVVNSLPSANINGTTTICQNSSSPFITFAGSNGTAPYTFSYTINGGGIQTTATTSGNSVTVSVPTNTAGTFTYSLISVQDNSSTACVNAVSGNAVVTINPQPISAIITTPLAHLCNGEASQITITNYVSGFSYAWYKDGVFLKSTTGDTIMNNKAGSFYAMPTSDKGCAAASNSDTIIISTGTITTPVITGWLHVCPGGKTKLTIIPTDADKPFEVWRWTDTPYGRLLNEDSSFSALAGQYQLRVEREGCYDSALVTVTADDTVYPAGQLVINLTHIFYGAQVVLTADVINAVQYNWNLGNADTATSFTNTISQNLYIAGDSVRLSVHATSERNCQADFTAFVKVDPPVFDSVKNNSFAGNLKDWNVFPIPFTDHLKVSVILERSETIRLDLFTSDGKWIRGWSLQGIKGENLFTLDNISMLTPGVVYFITGVYNGQKHFDKVYKN